MGEPPDPSLVPSGRLEEADDVAVCVLHGGYQFAPTYVLDLLLCLRAGVEESLQALAFFMLR